MTCGIDLTIKIRIAGSLEGRLNKLGGTSSFGMSGVNAHLVMAPIARQTFSQNDVLAQYNWERARYYPMAKTKAMAMSASCLQGGACSFDFALDSRASFLCDYFVGGHLIMPNFALVEGASSALSLINERSQHITMSNVVLPRQMTLPASLLQTKFTCTLQPTKDIVIFAHEEADMPREATGVLLQAKPCTMSREDCTFNFEQLLPVTQNVLEDTHMQIMMQKPWSIVTKGETLGLAKAKASCNSEFVSHPGCLSASLDLWTLHSMKDTGSYLHPQVLAGMEAYDAYMRKSNHSQCIMIATHDVAVASLSAAGWQRTCCKRIQMQLAKRASKDIRTTIEKMVYRVEWQGSLSTIVDNDAPTQVQHLTLGTSH